MSSIESPAELDKSDTSSSEDELVILNSDSDDLMILDDPSPVHSSAPSPEQSVSHQSSLPATAPLPLVHPPAPSSNKKPVTHQSKLPATPLPPAPIHPSAEQSVSQQSSLPAMPPPPPARPPAPPPSCSSAPGCEPRGVSERKQFERSKSPEKIYKRGPPSIIRIHPNLKDWIDKSSALNQVIDDRSSQRRKPIANQAKGTKRRRQVVRHGRVTIAMCVTSNGFTITDGSTSISVDDPNGVKDVEILEEIRKMGAARVIFSDYNSKKWWQRAKKQYQSRDGKLFRVTEDGFTTSTFSVGKCHYCRKQTCHRWLALVGGIARFHRELVEPIAH